MPNPLQRLLERLAERGLALATGLVATAMESLHLQHQAEQQRQLEELARRYEAEGQPELAATLRERIARLDWDTPAVHGAGLWEERRDAAPAVRTGTIDDSTPRLPTKSRRARTTEPTSDPTGTPLAERFPFPALDAPRAADEGLR